MFTKLVFLELSKMISSSDTRKVATSTLVINNFSQMTTHQSTELYIDNKKIYFGLFPKIDISSFQNGNSFVYWWNAYNNFVGNVQFEVSILNAKNEKLYTIGYNWKFDSSTNHPVAKLIPRECLLDSKNGYLVNDRLTLLCVAKFASDKAETKSIQSNTSKLVEDYEALLNSGDYSDATLVIGEKEFRVHKLILAARSPVLGVMFKHEQTSEARSNQVDIIDVEVDVFEQLIRYIYTGKVEALDRLALELMAVADKYQVNSLKDICEEYLCSNLAIESVANVLLIADLHRAAELRSKCIDYIAKNVRKVKATEGWKLLDAKHELVVEILLHLSDEYKNICA